MAKQYRDRITDQILRDELQAIGAILLEGPKWCGKTTTAKQQAGSVLSLGNPNERRANELRAQTNPSALLIGDTPRLIDEWQVLANQIWDAVRYEVDERGEFGQFILTGSATPVHLDKDTHSGVGRIKRLRMRTMSLYESGDSEGSVSLEQLFDSTDGVIDGASDIRLDELAYLICRGGWPTAVTASSEKIAIKQAKNYYETVISQEQYDGDGVQLSDEWLAAILRSYARNIGTSATVPSILEDCRTHGGYSFSDKTLENYIAYLKRIFLLEDMTAWNPNLRSRTAIRTSPVRYYADPSVAVCALGTGRGSILDDLETFGFLYENLAVRDLRIYAESIDGRVYHYRDRNGLECDSVVVLPDGRYGLFEMKLGGESLIEEAAAHLKKLESILDTKEMGAPVCKAVLCGVAPYAYTRPDGVCVIPIGCLRN